MANDERSAEAREIAERALGRLLAASAPTGEELIVLGGLVPPTLTRTDAPEVPAHLGTTDIDVLLVTHLTAEHDLGRIEMALETMQFTPQVDGWRWSGRIEDRIVKIEFLCDLDDQPAEAIVSPVGCSRLRAVNLRGTGYVERDHHEYILHVPEGNLRVQIAGLAGYLLSKSVAVRTRGADKDYYDLAYVLLHNDAGGPTEAANIVKASPLADALPSLSSTFTVEDVRDRVAAHPCALGMSSYRKRSASPTSPFPALWLRSEPDLVVLHQRLREDCAQGRQKPPRVRRSPAEQVPDIRSRPVGCASFTAGPEAPGLLG